MLAVMGLDDGIGQAEPSLLDDFNRLSTTERYVLGGVGLLAAGTLVACLVRRGMLSNRRRRGPRSSRLRAWGEK